MYGLLCLFQALGTPDGMELLCDLARGLSHLNPEGVSGWVDQWKTRRKTEAEPLLHHTMQYRGTWERVTTQPFIEVCE